MKILHINTHDAQGGAARAAYRLHRALLEQQIDSQVLVQTKITSDHTVIGPTNKFEKGFNLFRPFLDSLPTKKYKNRTQSLFSPAWLPLSQAPKKVAEIDPDIVHLHWICGGMMSVSDLARINKPIVWTLHDMWAFTGGEHIDEGQQHYLNKCGNSWVLKSNRDYDLSHKGWLKKQKIYAQLSNITIVEPSQWLYQCAKNSSLMRDMTHITIPNLLNTQQYAPFSKLEARRLLNLPSDKKIIAFGAMSATDDPNKGFMHLYAAMQTIEVNNIELVVFGSSRPQDGPVFKQPVHYLGHLYDDISLRVLYSAADVMVVPSLQENLSNAIMESLACGTPVVAFDVGGNSDMIDHEKNGYLAKPVDSQDLADGIKWVLDAPNYDQLCNNAREKVLRHFDSKVVVRQYIELYKEILAK